MARQPQARPTRGRPVGSIALTVERRRTILALIEAGTFDYVAAEASGIDARTFRDWIARGERRHPTRSATPALVSLANEVREAKARARAAREVTVATKNPEYWLSHVARSKPGREGWTEPVEEPGTAATTPPPYAPNLEEAASVMQILLRAGAVRMDEEPLDEDEDTTEEGDQP